MPHAQNDLVRLFWKQDGADHRPAILLLHSVLTSHEVWDRLIPFLTDDYRIIRMDLRGHGSSTAVEGDYNLGTLAADAWAVLDAAEVDKAIICGVSLGGLIALQMAHEQPERVESLIIANSAVHRDRALWQDRIDEAQQDGVISLVASALDCWFGKGEPIGMRPWIDPLRRVMLATPVAGYCGCAAAMRDFELEQAARELQVPTLVISSTNDRGTAFSPRDKRIAKLIPHAMERSISGGHYVFVENPGAFANVIAARPVRDVEAQALAASPAINGERVRRSVLGDAWVDASIAKRNDWIADYQDYATQVAWHGIWSRAGLDHRTRRLLTIAMTAALGRWEEYRLHVRSGLERQSLTVQDIKEISLQAGLYAGVPVANTAFAECAKLFEDMGISADPC